MLNGILKKVLFVLVVVVIFQNWGKIERVLNPSGVVSEQTRASARVASVCDIETGVTMPATKAGTWVYEFAWQKPSTGLADHCVDVPFVFNCLKDEHVAKVFGTDSPPRGLASAIQTDWVRFISVGDPGFPSWREGERGRIYGSQSHSGVKSARPFQIEVNMMRLMREL